MSGLVCVVTHTLDISPHEWFHVCSYLHLKHPSLSGLVCVVVTHTLDIPRPERFGVCSYPQLRHTPA